MKMLGPVITKFQPLLVMFVGFGVVSSQGLVFSVQFISRKIGNQLLLRYIDEIKISRKFFTFGL